MMTHGFSDEDILMLSGIQHFAFCRRQWALIHLEQQWQENLLTFKGRQLHERADDPFVTEARGTAIITRSLPLVMALLSFLYTLLAHDCTAGIGG